MITLEGPIRLAIQVRRCRDADCPRYRASLRSEQEGRFALPQHEFGLDVIATVGTLRHAEHRSVPEIHAELVRRGVPICVRSVGNLLDRYDELLALSLTDAARIRRLTAPAGRVILAIDGLQPDVGHEVLWVVRDVLSGEVLLAKSLLSGTRRDLAELLGRVRDALRVPVAGVVSDGQRSLVQAIAEAFPGVPHQRCQFHYLREAARPIYEADRHAKVELKKHVRGVRPIERLLEGRDDAEAAAARGYCAAVRCGADRRRSAAAGGLGTEAGGAAASGRREPRPGRGQGGLPAPLKRLRALLAKGLSATEAAWPDVRRAFGWVHRAADILANGPGGDGAAVRRRLRGLLGAMGRHAGSAGRLAPAVAPLRQGDAELLARACSPATTRPICRGPIMTWSSSSARTAITSGGPAGGSRPRRGPGSAGRCGSSPRRRRGWARVAAADLVPVDLGRLAIAAGRVGGPAAGPDARADDSGRPAGLPATP